MDDKGSTAHKHLLEVYRTRLQDANSKIMELEMAVSNGEARLEQIDMTDVETLAKTQDSLTNVQHELNLAKTEMAKLHAAVGRRQYELEMANLEVQRHLATIEDLQQQRTLAENVRMNCEQHHSNVDRIILEKQGLDNHAKQLEQSVKDKTAELETATADWELRISLEQAKTYAGSDIMAQEAVYAQIKSLHQQLAEARELLGLERKYASDLASENRSHKEAYSIVNKSRAAAEKDAESLRRRLNSAIAGRGLMKKSVHKAEMEKMQIRVDREKKRRHEAQALHGSSTKRCRRCEPEVIILDDDEGEQSGPVRQASALQQQLGTEHLVGLQQQEAITSPAQQEVVVHSEQSIQVEDRGRRPHVDIAAAWDVLNRQGR
ncbi:hypothetical protein LTR56_000493 [Elasticomyces elasticus]|nr:hypothetical protein LTR22_014221 [Elasticomyces elasticus]KAK3660735.1 hypothetical protein LTR56_000493 [Elasticomyces elasticus]KAK4922881.1 hypothetical protein LTR49_009888 [Elasticomyces elasticus]KAK5759743.1 hypothetical protein LTS12_010083 [Elasticomyces elasticus]